MSYLPIETRLAGDHVVSTVEYTFRDGSRKTVEVLSFRPRTEADVIADITGREESEQMALDALKTNEAIVISLQDAIGKLVETNVAIPEAPFRMSKLKLLNALDAAGLEDVFVSFLAANPKLERRFNASQFLMTDDPLVAETVPAFVEATGVAPEQVATMFESCRD